LTTKMEKKSFSYLEAIGCFMFWQLGTRHDISYIVNIVAKFTSKPSHIHFAIMKRIYKYLRRTVHWGICYQSKTTVNLLEAYIDVDFLAHLIDKKSRSNFVVQMNGGLVS
jgi:hypothetical protein